MDNYTSRGACSLRVRIGDVEAEWSAPNPADLFAMLPLEYRAGTAPVGCFDYSINPFERRTATTASANEATAPESYSMCVGDVEVKGSGFVDAAEGHVKVELRVPPVHADLREGLGSGRLQLEPGGWRDGKPTHVAVVKARES